MTASVVLRGGTVLVGDSWVESDLTIVDGVIVDGPTPSGVPVVDVSGSLVAPGLVDLQCNGAAGIDLRSDPERLWDVAADLTRWGVTAWLPTIPTSIPAVVDRALAALADGPPPSWVGAVPIGLHLEGPFLSPAAVGAHPVELLRAPSIADVRAWSAANGVSLVTLAPELDGALEVIEALVSRSVVVSIGHSMASAAQVDAAVDAGASSVTHLFNAMSALHHRAPGVVGAALSDERLAVGIIADGVHVDSRVVGVAARALGDRLILVSDAVAPLGIEGFDPKDGVRLPDGTLAGSVLPLVQAVRNLVAWTDWPVEQALAAASARPAAVLSDVGRGSLTPGSAGDVIVLGPSLDLERTIVAGTTVHRAD